MVLGGFTAGLLWAFPPAILKVKMNVDEVVTTLLLNSVILFVTSFLLNGPWRDPVSMWPQSPEIAAGTVFFKLIPRTRLHFGFIIAIIVILVTWFVIKRTSFGLKMRAIGLSKEGAHFAGIKVNKTMMIVALVSGGIAGLAGAGEVAGIHFHLIDAISDGLGYSGIIIATLGGLNPFGVGIAAFFIGLIDTGAQTVSRVMGVPVYLGDVVQSTLLLVTLSLFVLQNFRIRRVK
jgi:simple sugar transport system permease protein